MKSLCRILFLLLCATTGVEAQHPDFWSLNEESGLPSNVVYDIMEDDHGYIWIGTDKGLARYNGLEVKTYTSDSQKSLSITGLQQDRWGRIWGVNFSRQVFYVENDSLKELELPKQKDSNGHLKIELIDDQLFVYSYGQADRLNLAKMNWDLDFTGKTWPITINGVDRKLLHSISGNGDSYALNFSGEIQLVENDNQKFKVTLPYKNRHHRSTWYNGEQYLVPHHFDPLLKVDSRTGDTAQVPITHPLHSAATRILVCCDDGKGDLWLCTSAGARNLSAPTEYAERLYFPDKQISRVIKDREGSLWFATLQHGVQIVPSIEIMVFNSENSTLRFDEVSSLGRSVSNKIIVGSYNGLVQEKGEKYDFKEPRDLGFRKEVNGFFRYQDDVFAFGEKMISVTDGSIKSVGRPVSIKQVTALNDECLALITSEGFAIAGFSESLPSLCDHWTLEDSEEFKGMVLNREGGFRRFQLGPSDSIIYTSTTEGLFYHSPKRKVELRAPNDSSIYSLDLVIDEDGILWASTVSQGIVGFKGTEIYKSITSDIFNRSVQFSSIDVADGMIWIAGDDGLYRVKTESLEWEKVDMSDGLPTNSINDIYVLDDAVWLGTMAGLARVPVNYSSVNSVIPNLNLGTFLLNNEEIESISDLAYSENNISFNLEPIALRSRGSATINYRLLGLSEEWSETEISDNEIRFLALAPGEYTFEAKLINEDGFESEIVSAEFSISPPFWQTWWFYLLVILIIVMILIGIFSFRLREQRKRDAVQHDLRVSELTALKAQMNPHFVFNALNSIQDYVLMNQTELANDYLGKFARLMRQTLDQSQQISVTLSDDLELLKLYLELEAIRFEDEFDYKISVGVNMNVEQIEIPSMIVQPFVENAIKHGLLHKKEDRELLIDFKMSGSVLECRIEDNGIGLEASRKMNESRSKSHRSFGTGAVKKRLDLLNQGRRDQISIEMKDVTDISKGVSGTHVMLRIPIKREFENA